MERRGTRPGPLFVELTRRGERRRLAAGGLYFIMRRLGEELGVRVRPHGLRHASITSVLTLAADRGLPMPEVLAATGHARASIAVVLAYFDQGRSRQGELARLVAGTVEGGGSKAGGKIGGPIAEEQEGRGPGSLPSRQRQGEEVGKRQLLIASWRRLHQLAAGIRGQ